MVEQLKIYAGIMCWAQVSQAARVSPQFFVAHRGGVKDIRELADCLDLPTWSFSKMLGKCYWVTHLHDRLLVYGDLGPPQGAEGVTNYHSPPAVAPL